MIGKKQDPKDNLNSKPTGAGEPMMQEQLGEAKSGERNSNTVISIEFDSDLKNRLSKVNVRDCQSSTEQSMLMGDEYFRFCMETALSSDDYELALVAIFEQTTAIKGPCHAMIDEKANIKFVYQCVDCQMKPNAGICPPCFDREKHKGHR